MLSFHAKSLLWQLSQNTQKAQQLLLPLSALSRPETNLSQISNGFSF